MLVAGRHRTPAAAPTGEEAGATGPGIAGAIRHRIATPSAAEGSLQRATPGLEFFNRKTGMLRDDDRACGTKARSAIVNQNYPHTP